jgi:hypothetical protein
VSHEVSNIVTIFEIRCDREDNDDESDDQEEDD